MLGMEDQYNTKLSPEEEAAFQLWAKASGKLQDTYDYDLRGYWKDTGGISSEGHFTDKFKKPNHPTFSNESMYHGVDGNQGGLWAGDEKTGFSFVPGATNLSNYSPLDLQRYFEQTEPDVKLMLPNEDY